MPSKYPTEFLFPSLSKKLNFICSNKHFSSEMHVFPPKNSQILILFDPLHRKVGIFSLGFGSVHASLANGYQESTWNEWTNPSIDQKPFALFCK